MRKGKLFYKASTRKSEMNVTSYVKRVGRENVEHPLHRLRVSDALSQGIQCVQRNIRGNLLLVDELTVRHPERYNGGLALRPANPRVNNLECPPRLEEDEVSVVRWN